MAKIVIVVVVVVVATVVNIIIAALEIDWIALVSGLVSTISTVAIPIFIDLIRRGGTGVSSFSETFLLILGQYDLILLLLLFLSAAGLGLIEIEGSASGIWFVVYLLLLPAQITACFFR